MSGIGQTILAILPGRLDTSGAVESDPRIVAAEQILARWYMEPGSCSWDDSAGLGLGLLVNADLSPGDRGRLEVTARAEAKAVIGVVDCRCQAVLSEGLLTVTGIVRLDTGATFTLVAPASGAAEVLT